MPRLRKRNVGFRPEPRPLKARLPFAADATSKKKANCKYALGSNCGDKRLKSKPNFRLCLLFCIDKLSTTLICRSRLCPVCPTSKPCGKENMVRTSWPFWDEKGLGNGRDANGAA